MRFEIFRGRNCLYYFRFVAANGQVIVKDVDGNLYEVDNTYLSSNDKNAKFIKNYIYMFSYRTINFYIFLLYKRLFDNTNLW